MNKNSIIIIGGIVCALLTMTPFVIYCFMNPHYFNNGYVSGKLFTSFSEGEYFIVTIIIFLFCLAVQSYILNK